MTKFGLDDSSSSSEQLDEVKSDGDSSKQTQDVFVPLKASKLKNTLEDLTQLMEKLNFSPKQPAKAQNKFSAVK